MPLFMSASRLVFSRLPAHRLLVGAGAAFAPLLIAIQGGLQGLWGALALSLAFGIAGVFYGDLGGSGRSRGAEWRAAVYALLCALSVGVFYGATGQVIRTLGRPRQDALLQGWDRALLGGFFPDGQVSLFLDRQEFFGPGSFVGKALTELFQVSYFSYYLWGFGLLGILFVRFLKRRKRAALPVDGRALDAEKLSTENDLLDFLCAWAGTYWVNFLCYIAIPVIGPKYDYPQKFVNPVDGFGFARVIQDFIVSQQAVSEDCFPSGHTALSWVTALAALRFAPTYARVVVPLAGVITLATLYLRYHYVADVLAALGLIGMATLWGRLHRR
jgi:membrane-associated phospholipid phosphatase